VPAKQRDITATKRPQDNVPQPSAASALHKKAGTVPIPGIFQRKKEIPDLKLHQVWYLFCRIFLSAEKYIMKSECLNKSANVQAFISGAALPWV
jgi:hypothetical protein